MKKINYELNENNEIMMWCEFPFDIESPFIEVENPDDIIVRVDMIIGGKLVKGDKAAYDAKIEADTNKMRKLFNLKTELESVKHDIEQTDLFGMIRDDITQKRTRAAEIVNELRSLEGKTQRGINYEI